MPDLPPGRGGRTGELDHRRVRRPVATFTDSDRTAGAGDFTARIDWGDGSVSDGTVSGGAGSFAVAGAHAYAEKGRFTVKVDITGTDGSIATATTRLDNLSTQAPGTVTGTVPATLALSVGGPATFGAFAPGVAKDYTASTTATVVSSAGDARLSVSGGHLTNGAFALAAPLQARAASPLGAGGALADVGAATPLLAYAAPVANDPVTLTFQQHIGASDPLRTGNYSATLTFTLSTTNP